MIHLIATRKITAFLFAMAWLAFVGQGPSYSQPPIAEGKIYWANPKKGIHRSDLDGTDVEQLVESELRYPADIALDVLRGKMYWTDKWRGGGIYWSDLDGSDTKPLMDDDYRSEGATNIALDVDGGKIYWTSVVSGGDVLDGWVARANLDGSNSEILFNRSHRLWCMDRYFWVSRLNKDRLLSRLGMTFLRKDSMPSLPRNLSCPTYRLLRLRSSPVAVARRLCIGCVIGLIMMRGLPRAVA